MSTTMMNERKIESKQFRVMAKRKAARPSKIIRQEFQKLDESNLQTKDLKNVALAVYRERRKELPVLPKSRIEANEALKSTNLNTNKDESFMMVNDQENGIIVKLSCSKFYFHLPVVNRGQWTNIVWLTEEVFKNEAPK